MTVAEQEQALTAIIDDFCASQCAAIRARAQQETDALLEQAFREARRMVHQAVSAEREHASAIFRSVRAGLQTEHRRQAQQQNMALLETARRLLETEIQRRWHDTDARNAWVAATVRQAQGQLPSGPWEIVHAPDWPAPERRDVAASVTEHAPHFTSDDKLRAGLAISAAGVRLDATLEGLLSDRTAVGARLLALLLEQEARA